VDRLLVAVALVVVAVAVAAVLRRRPGDGPTQTRWAVPTQLDPGDLGAPDTPWAVVVFSSAACDSCAEVLRIVGSLADPTRATLVDVEVGASGDLHERYGIEAVPTLVLVDAATGLVRASMVGPLDDDDTERLVRLAAGDPPPLDDGTPVELP